MQCEYFEYREVSLIVNDTICSYFSIYEEYLLSNKILSEAVNIVLLLSKYFCIQHDKSCSIYLLWK